MAAGSRFRIAAVLGAGVAVVAIRVRIHATGARIAGIRRAGVAIVAIESLSRHADASNAAFRPVASVVVVAILRRFAKLAALNQDIGAAAFAIAGVGGAGIPVQAIEGHRIAPRTWIAGFHGASVVIAAVMSRVHAARLVIARIIRAGISILAAHGSVLATQLRIASVGGTRILVVAVRWSPWQASAIISASFRSVAGIAIVAIAVAFARLAPRYQDILTAQDLVAGIRCAAVVVVTGNAGMRAARFAIAGIGGAGVLILAACRGMRAPGQWHTGIVGAGIGIVAIHRSGRATDERVA